MSKPAATASALRYVRALRAFSFPLSVLPVLVGTAGVLPPAQWRWGVLAAAMLLVLALHSAGNLLNDYFDYLSGVDSREQDDEGRPGRVLVRGDMSPGQVLAEALVCLGIGAAAAAFLVWRSGPGLLGFILPGAAALYAHTGPPLKFKSRGLGELLMLVVFGPLLVGGGAWAQVGAFPLRLILLSIPVGMVTTSVLAGNNLRDYEEDGAAGVRTLARIIGRRCYRWLYLALVVGQSMGVALYGLAGPASPVLAAAPALMLLVLPTLRRVWRGERLPDVDVRTTQYGTALMVFLFVVLLLD